MNYLSLLLLLGPVVGVDVSKAVPDVLLVTSRKQFLEEIKKPRFDDVEIAPNFYLARCGGYDFLDVFMLIIRAGTQKQAADLFGLFTNQLNESDDVMAIKRSSDSTTGFVGGITKTEASAAEINDFINAFYESKNKNVKLIFLTPT